MSSFKGDKVLKEHPTLSPLQASEEIMIYLSELSVLLERFETCKSCSRLAFSREKTPAPAMLS